VYTEGNLRDALISNSPCTDIELQGNVELDKDYGPLEGTNGVVLSGGENMFAIDGGGGRNDPCLSLKGPGVEMTLENIEIRNCGDSTTNSVNGGAISVTDGAVMNVDGAWIHDNTAQYGAGIYVDDSEVFLKGSRVSDNEAEQTTSDSSSSTKKRQRGQKSSEQAPGGSGASRNGGHGGGIHARSGALLSVKKSVITDNMAASGAGISLWGNSVGLIEASEVTHNEALLEAGGLYVFEGSATVIKSIVSWNQADYGAGISGHFANLRTVSSEVKFNTAASLGGGGIYASRTALDVDDCTIEGNKAALGAGLLIDESPTLTVIKDSAIIYNLASDLLFGGGGIVAFNGASLEVISTLIGGNTAVGNGGGLLAIEGSSVSLSAGSKVLDNSAEYGGGISGDSASFYKITETMIADNTATQSGGGIALDEDSVAHVTVSTITGNSAGAVGGGLLMEGGSLYFDKSEITDNRAEQGGGLALVAVSAVITATAIEENLARDGAGIAAFSEVFLTMKESTFKANFAAEYVSLCDNS